MVIVAASFRLHYIAMNISDTFSTPYDTFFDANGNACLLDLSSSGLNLFYTDKPTKSLKISIESIIAVTHKVNVAENGSGKIISIDFHILSPKQNVMSFECRQFTDGSQSAFGIIDKWRRRFLQLEPNRFTKKVLILINSYGGGGKAVSQFDEMVKPLLTVAGVPYEVITTRYARHAIDVGSNTQLTDYQGVVIMSGDGLIHQFLNGVANRCDWAEAIGTPLAVLPGGTGNAMVGHVLQRGGLLDPKELVRAATLVLIKHRVVNFDLAYIETRHTSVFCALGASWGLLADIINEGERHRWLGLQRYKCVGIKRFIWLQTHSGQVDYLLYEEKTTVNSLNRGIGGDGITLRYLPPRDAPIPSNWKSSAGKFFAAIVLSTPNIATDFFSCPTRASMTVRCI